MLALLIIGFIFLFLFGLQSNADVTGATDTSGNPLTATLDFVFGGGMLNADQLAQLAFSAGFGQDTNIAVAVALAESSGNPRAYNPEGSYGLWQIYIKAHPEFAALVDPQLLASGSGLYDPVINAQAAFNVYSVAGDSFYPWSTFKNGKYLAYMDSANLAVANLG